MGNFRLELELVGGHGCRRNVKDGGTVTSCGASDCPDCRIVEFVAQMAKRCSFVEAKLIHWPNTTSQVVDEIVPEKNTVESYADFKGEQQHYVATSPAHRIRHGNFN